MRNTVYSSVVGLSGPAARIIILHTESFIYFVGPKCVFIYIEASKYNNTEYMASVSSVVAHIGLQSQSSEQCLPSRKGFYVNNIVISALLFFHKCFSTRVKYIYHILYTL